MTPGLTLLSMTALGWGVSIRFVADVDALTGTSPLGVMPLAVTSTPLLMSKGTEPTLSSPEPARVAAVVMVNPDGSEPANTHRT